MAPAADVLNGRLASPAVILRTFTREGSTQHGAPTARRRTAAVVTPGVVWYYRFHLDGLSLAIRIFTPSTGCGRVAVEELN